MQKSANDYPQNAQKRFYKASGESQGQKISPQIIIARAEILVIFRKVCYNKNVSQKIAYKKDFTKKGKYCEKTKGGTAMEKFAFIADLDDYFCEKYANYDRICILKGYVMPKMQTTERREDGTDYSYTLPASTMRLATQANKADLLSQLKEKMTEYTFSFSFRPLGFFEKIKYRHKKDSFKKVFAVVCAKYSLTPTDALSACDISEKTIKRLLTGAYYPTKNLVYTLALVHGFSEQDTNTLMDTCTFSYDFTIVKDVIISYLIANKVTNPDMVAAALNEYNVDGLFFRTKESAQGENHENL